MPTLPPSLAPLVALTDSEAVARVLAGETYVFELLMRRHNRRLFRVCYAVLDSRDEAEDVVQDAYVRAYRHLPRYEGRASVATWLTRIALHESLRRRRRARLAAAARRTLSHADHRTQAAPMPATPDHNPLKGCLDQLPESLRAVLMLRLVEGLSTRETAASLRMTEANVKVSLHRARAILRRALDESLLDELRAQTSFDGDRCDRVVAGVFERINGPASQAAGQDATRRS